MAVLSRSTREMHARLYAGVEARRRAQQEAEAAKNEKMIAKRERELDELEAKLSVDPPPELSPRERKERELAERLDRLEGRQLPALPHVFSSTAASRENQLREDLRLRRNRRDAEQQTVRDREHEERCAPQTKQLSRQIADVQARQQSERDRHQQAIGELNAERTTLLEKLEALNRGLGPEETTEQRLQAVMA